MQPQHVMNTESITVALAGGSQGKMSSANLRDTTPESVKSGSATSTRNYGSNNGSPETKPRRYVSSATLSSHGSAFSLSARNYSVISSAGYQFIVFDAPTDHSVDRIVEDLKSMNCNTVVRACHESYNPKAFTQNDIELTSLYFPDGSMPSKSIIKRWIEKVTINKELSEGPIGVHCVAGLGRSPLLVAIALIELAGLSAEASIELIRDNRRGAINRKQEEFIKGYEKEKKKRDSSNKCMACAIM